MDILFEKQGEIAIITLNRPERGNAFTINMIEQWADALEEYNRDDSVRAVVLTGKGDKGFCSGIDLDDFNSMENTSSIGGKEILTKNIHRVPLALKRLDKPMICAVNGVAVGAGMDMSLMCDIRFASENAKFSEGYIKLGLVPGDGGAYYLPRIVGVAKALEMLWTGDFISAEEAEKLGIVNAIYSQEELLPKTLEFAERLANAPAIAIQMIKRAVYQSLETDLETSLDLISSHFSIVRDSEDHQEGLAAMLEKRKPNFTGR